MSTPSDYYLYAKKEYTQELCDSCQRRCSHYFSNHQSLCEICPTRIIINLVSIIDEYKKFDGFLAAHGCFDKFAFGYQNKVVKEEPPYLDLGGPLD